MDNEGGSNDDLQICFDDDKEGERNDEHFEQKIKIPAGFAVVDIEGFVVWINVRGPRLFGNGFVPFHREKQEPDSKEKQEQNAHYKQPVKGGCEPLAIGEDRDLPDSDSAYK